eukprot:1159840-Pelagomonas_calceolata.AAC.3
MSVSRNSSIKRSWEEGSGERRAPPKTNEGGGAETREDGYSMGGSEDGECPDMVGEARPSTCHAELSACKRLSRVPVGACRTWMVCLPSRGCLINRAG